MVYGKSSEVMTSVEDAQACVLAQFSPLPTEMLPLEELAGRVLATDIASDIDISPFDNSAMDGFAVRYADFADFVEAAGVIDEEHPLILPCIGEIGAGEVWPQGLAAGETLRIMTGAAVPEGADTVVQIEHVEVLGVDAEHPAGTSIIFSRMPRVGANVRLRGEEAHAGDILLHAGDRITPAAAGLLAATGNAQAEVYRQPRVAILSTGNELVNPGELPGPGQIRNSNSYSLAVQVREAGGIPLLFPIVPDDPDALRASILEAAASSEFIVASGGAAEGDFDYIVSLIRELGELFFSKVNMKPGKAQTFGLIQGTPFLGLAGNPTSASVGFEVLGRRALRRMQGLSSYDRPITKARLSADINKKAEKRRLFLRARLERDADGSYTVSPDKFQSSALLGALNRSNCLLIVPEGYSPLVAGTMVDCLRLDMEEGVL